MKIKNIGLIASFFTIIGIGLFLRSQEVEKEDQEEKTELFAADPVVSNQYVKDLLGTIDHQITVLQQKIAENSQFLPHIFAKWKREGKLKLAQQWHQTKHAITQLDSQIKQILNSADLLALLQKNETLIKQLEKLKEDAKNAADKTTNDKVYMMKLASVFGQAIFNEKLLENTKALETKLVETVKVQETQKPQYLERYIPEYDKAFKEEQWQEPIEYDEYQFDDFSFELDDDDFGSFMDDDYFDFDDAEISF